MAIELLIHASAHRAIHDAESLLFVLIFLCTHLKGPGLVGCPPVFGSNLNHPSGVKDWLSATNLVVLGHTKFSQMNFHLYTHILDHLSDYFLPLRPVISELWTALFPSPNSSSSQIPSRSNATLRTFINVLKTMLLDEKLKATAKNLSDERKLKRPGDSFMPSNSWDPIPAPKKQTKAKINSSASPKTLRGKSVLHKSQRRSKSQGK
jgi:hypothetical protein